MNTTLRDLRRQAGLTQVELAKKCECAQHTISGLERGIAGPSLPLARRIAAELGVSLDAVADAIDAGKAQS